VKYGLIAMGANTAMGVDAGLALAHAGLALATSLAAFLNAGLLFFQCCRRRDIYQPTSRLDEVFVATGAANLAMGLVLGSAQAIGQAGSPPAPVNGYGV